MSNTEKMIDLLRAIKVDTNGAVVGAMQERGLSYAMSYGVALPTIRVCAKVYYPDTDFAKFLYLQQVRELRLSALYIADPKQVTLENGDFWLSGMETSEIADVVAMKLFSSSDDAWEFAYKYLESENVMACYSSLMTGLRLIDESSLDYLNHLNVVKHTDAIIRIALEKIESKFDMLSFGC
ncbi:MAG: hypothetical protein R3Y38_01925 [Rikenellaceae bacterium]